MQHDILLRLAHNTSLRCLLFPSTQRRQQSIVLLVLAISQCLHLIVSTGIIKECFASNTTLAAVVNAPSPVIEWFARLNSACKQLGSSEVQRNSVPLGLDINKIPGLLEYLKERSEPWKKMKLVVLGHGQIGKTTLVAALHNILNPSDQQQVHYTYIDLLINFNYVCVQIKDILSTVGIECSPLRLESGEVNVWDFGGQLEYTVTHGFFLSLKVHLRYNTSCKVYLQGHQRI